MSIGSRTPEGWSNVCPVCDSRVIIEPSTETHDAPCPRCGCLLWFAQRFNVSFDELNDPEFLRSAVSDSLDFLELVMELEEAFEIDIPDEDAARIFTIDDAIRYIVRRRGEKET